MIVKVKLFADYGRDCYGLSYGSQEEVEVEISDTEATALKRINPTQVTCEQVQKAIKKKDSGLKALHRKLSLMFEDMELEYWLSEVDCEMESLKKCIMQDINEGLFDPHDENEELYGDWLDDWDDESDEPDEQDEPDEPEKPEKPEEQELKITDDVLYRYRDWVWEHEETDKRFVAQRVGLNLDMSDLNYTIFLTPEQ